MHEEREPCLKIGITLAIFKLSGNMPCLSDNFMICVSGRNILSAARADVRYHSQKISLCQYLSFLIVDKPRFHLLERSERLVFSSSYRLSSGDPL